MRESPFPAQEGFSGAAAHADPNWPGQGVTPDPYAEHFSAYADSQTAYPGVQSAAGEFPEDGKGVSPLHVALTAIILLAGLALGIGRSWWIDQKLAAEAAKKAAVPALAAGSPAAQASSSTLQSSIDRAFIPPAMDPQKDAYGADPAAGTSPTDNQALPRGEMQTKPTSPLEQKEAEAPTISQQQGATADTVTPPAARAESAIQPSEKKRRSSRQDASRKAASASKKERMREIERVRSQAFSETSKDRIGTRKEPESSLGPQSERRSSRNKLAQHVVTSAQYARCERIDHIIRREQCKWELCNNKWGTGGCPSFN